MQAAGQWRVSPEKTYETKTNKEKKIGLTSQKKKKPIVAKTHRGKLKLCKCALHERVSGGY